ncbi:hypothetical protein AX16_004456 [Volvariella volvacea WC 439]|nr:hypothetical protein AX16_004456 [Volvariella volvacea WC 439]
MLYVTLFEVRLGRRPAVGFLIAGFVPCTQTFTSMAANNAQRFRFTPLPRDEDKTPALRQNGTEWLTMLSCSADFPAELFQVAASQLIHHPEYNSTLILRSETLAEIDESFPREIPRLDGLTPLKCFHRKLLPRRPGRDEPLQQYCTLYHPTEDDTKTPLVLVLTPLMTSGTTLPYYHPTVYHLAFRYLQRETPILRIEVQPFSGTPTDPNSRLYRTCLALLQTLYKYGWGAMTNYQKRVMHDCLVAREPYQDLYLVMRERYKHLVNSWQEVTDPLKHVFEDIGIATYLMLLWKDTFKATPTPTAEDLTQEPWRQWPRPPGGFLDFGCGNGLLTHILVNEGYEGFGIDVRARASWSSYPSSTQERLKVDAFDPTGITTNEPLPAFHTGDSYLRPGVFIIGNHADELTPWVPVVSTLSSASGYISIPCCAWTFDAKFERSTTPTSFPVVPDFNARGKDELEKLRLGGSSDDTSWSSLYSVYRIWLAGLSLHCGWEVECETLRIPSTRNWAIIGRSAPKEMEEQAVENARDIVEFVRERGVFKTRRPEGKAGDH